MGPREITEWPGKVTQRWGVLVRSQVLVGPQGQEVSYGVLRAKDGEQMPMQSGSISKKGR